jgi:hypothetical protein
MSNDLLRILLAVVLFVHGVGHVVFMPVAYAAMKTPETGHSWLVSPVVGDAAGQWVATLLAAAAFALFAGAAIGIWQLLPWWRTLAVAGAIVSGALILAFFGGMPTSASVSAFALDVVVLVAILVAHWPSEAVAG